MNNKVLAAFIGGLIVASGITYVLMKRTDPAPKAVAATASAPSATDQPAPDAKPVTVDPEPVRETTPASTSASIPAVTRTQPAAPPRSKPSPAPEPKVPEPRPIQTAQSTPPPPPAPAPEPAEPAKPAAEPPAKAESVPPLIPRIEPPPPKPNSVTIPSGTNLIVRLGETLSTDRNRPGDTFSATLDQPLIVEGFVIAERGARVQGRVVESERSGRVKGLALMQVELTQLSTADGQRVKINTSAIERKADPTRKNDAAKVGIGAALGAAIGAIAGGGKGAAIGAGVGGAAGAGDVLLTRGKEVELKVESRLTFRLAEALTLTEKLR